jgi:hypothetical protein
VRVSSSSTASIGRGVSKLRGKSLFRHHPPPGRRNPPPYDRLRRVIQ